MPRAHLTPVSKPSKPYPDFPLFAHATRRWAKKICGRTHYFGPWDDPDGALAKYQSEKDALHSGRTPRSDPAILTIKELVNAFLNHKADLRDAGELSPRTWLGYKEVTDLLTARFGRKRFVTDLAPDDFAALRRHMARRWGPVRLGNTIQVVRSIFKHAFDADILAVPMKFGATFDRPKAKVLRLERAKRGAKMFEREEIRALLAKAAPNLKAMILLAINCGLGNADCARLPIESLDLERKWINFPRPKTGVERRCPLWPETVEAIRAVLAERPEPKDEAGIGLVFVTRLGGSWHKRDSDNPVSKETRKLLDSLGINGHRNFYCLRHSFRTVADEAKDQPAVNHIMGHAPRANDMSAVYRERISDERLKAVADHVRGALFAEGQS